MTASDSTISETKVINRLRENHSVAWLGLYDEYAPKMYGLILKLTEDKLLADQIFAHAFLQLKDQPTLSEIRSPLLAFLLKHSYCCAISHLKQSGIIPKTLKLSKEKQSLPIFEVCN